MKSLKIKFLEVNLKWIARLILFRHKTCVIGITGSIGKTTIKEAIYHLLKNNFEVRETKKNYNNEIGVPLTIIGSESGDDSVLDWLGVFWQGLKVLAGIGGYPKILILELAIDRPGDMEYLLSIVQIDIAVVSHITNAHQKFFKNIEQIAQEKGRIVENLRLNSCGGRVILNGDDCRVKKMATRTNGEVILYGYAETADLYASDINMIVEDDDLISVNFDHFDKQNSIISNNDKSILKNQAEGGKLKFQGLSFKLNYDGKIIPIRLKYVLADYHIHAVLASIAVANILKMNIVESAEQINSFRPPVGRMNLLQGISSSLIIDDTYNSSPKAMMSAIETFVKIPSQRKISIIGDMLELGDNSENEHKRIIKKLINENVDIIFLVGKRMRKAMQSLEKDSSFSNKIKQYVGVIKFFDSPIIAGEEILQIIQSGDFILVKGSQGMRMEKVVEKIMQDKKDAANLLCRQNISWIKKVYKMP